MAGSHKPRNPTFRVFILFIVLLTLVLAPLGARAGGAGATSHSSGSGRSSGSFHFSGNSTHYSSGGSALDLAIFINLVSLFFRVLGPVPATLIILAVAAGIWYSYRKGRKHNRSFFTYFDRFANPAPGPGTSGESPLGFSDPGRGVTRSLSEFKSRHPDFSESGFHGKVRHAFQEIQKAWTVQDLGPVRRFITDGVWQRYHTQFSMMQVLEQQNLLRDIQIHHIRIVAIRKDGPLDVIDVAIQASMDDEFRSPLLPGQNQRSREAFTEYWTFVRRQDIRQEGMDIYQNTQCPHCGSPLPMDLGENGQCPYCSSHVNSGEYDWVLSEITQEQDWIAGEAVLRGLRLGTVLQRIRKDDPEFSVQTAEDKASNAWMQLTRARITGQADLARRFVGDSLYEKLKANAASRAIAVPGGTGGVTLAYNRLFLNQVTLTGSTSAEGWDYLDFSLVASLQAVEIRSGKKVRLIDPAVREEQSILRLKRKAGSSALAKGRLYQHQCAACGAPIQDSSDTKCPYCSSVYNSGELEWVVEDLVGPGEYMNLGVKASRSRSIDPALMDEMFDVKDYAVNNLMIMAAADGVFTTEERSAMEGLISRLRYPVSNLDALWDLAKAGSLRLRMPHDVRKRRKIIDIMEKLAMADGDLDPREQAILDHLKGGILDENIFSGW